MLETTLWPSREPTWTLASPNARTVGSGGTRPFHVESKMPNVSNVIARISLSIIANSDGAAKLMPRRTPLDWKPRKANPARIHSSARTTEVNTRWTQTDVHFGGIDSTESGIRRNTSRFGTTEQSQFILKQMVPHANDYKKSQNIFAEHLEKLRHCHISPWIVNLIRHHLNPGTAVVWNPQGSEYIVQRGWTSHGHLPPSKLDHLCKDPFDW